MDENIQLDVFYRPVSQTEEIVVDEVSDVSESGEVVTIKTLQEVEHIEKLYLLPPDGDSYQGVPGSISSYFIDIDEPATYRIDIDNCPDLIYAVRIFLFHEQNLNKPIVDGGLYQASIREFLWLGRHRLVIHGMTGEHTISVSKAD